MFVMCYWNNLRRTATCERRRLHTLVSYGGPRQAPKSITAHMCLPPSSPCFGKFANGTKVVTGFTAIPHVRPLAGSVHDQRRTHRQLLEENPVGAHRLKHVADEAQGLWLRTKSRDHPP